MKSKNCPRVNSDLLATNWLSALAFASLLTASPLTSIAAFDASLSPPRFELQANPGEVTRQTVTVTNGSQAPARFSVKTSDWRIDENGRVAFEEGAPQAGSCRPWARLERLEISVPPNGSRVYRFEIHVPKDARSGECHLALLFAADAGTVAPSGGNQLQIPVIGRVAAIVYVNVGGAKPDLRLAKLAVRKIDNKYVPVAEFYNVGKAHGRVFGALEAKDAAGRIVTLIAQQSAILPNGQRALQLTPVDYSTGEPKAPTFDLQPPLHVRGKLQFLGGGEVSIDQIVR
jgi:hypothetical protein